MAKHLITGELFLDKRYIWLTMDDKNTYNNVMRILQHKEKRKPKTQRITLRDTIFKLLRVYELQNKHIINELWTKEQVDGHDSRNLKLTIR